MSSKFPLYNRFFTSTTKRDLTKKQKEDFVEKVKKMDKEGKELFYVLIQVYYIEHSGDITYGVPYNGTKTSKSATFNLEEFPKQLKQMLYKFTKEHLLKMIDDKQTDKQRKKVKATIKRKKDKEISKTS